MHYFYSFRVKNVNGIKKPEAGLPEASQLVFVIVIHKSFSMIGKFSDIIKMDEVTLSNIFRLIW